MSTVHNYPKMDYMSGKAKNDAILQQVNSNITSIYNIIKYQISYYDNTEKIDNCFKLICENGNLLDSIQNSFTFSISFPEQFPVPGSQSTFTYSNFSDKIIDYLKNLIPLMNEELARMIKIPTLSEMNFKKSALFALHSQYFSFCKSNLL